jgi:hypothetical protein
MALIFLSHLDGYICVGFQRQPHANYDGTIIYNEPV